MLAGLLFGHREVWADGQLAQWPATLGLLSDGRLQRKRKIRVVLGPSVMAPAVGTFHCAVAVSQLVEAHQIGG